MGIPLPEKELVPGFAEDVAMECLVRARLDYGTLLEVRKVCRKWRQIFSDYESGILKMRRLRSLQQPSIFLIPRGDPRSNMEACVTYKTFILMLGGQCRHEEEALRDVWIIDTLRHTLSKGVQMLTDRQFLGAAIVGGSLFAFGGESSDGNDIFTRDSVEHYDFDEEKWEYVSSMPYRTLPARCYVDSFSSTTTKLFVSGEGVDDHGRDIWVQYYYCPSNDTWTEADVTSYQIPVLPRSLKWMWCTGTMLFRKEMTSYEEGEDYTEIEEEVVVTDDEEAAWQFPFDITIPANVVTALIQPTNDSFTDKIPLKSASLAGKTMLILEEDNQTGSAIISCTVVPTNAEFYPLSVISRVESTSMVADVVTMNAMRADMFFQNSYSGSTNEKWFNCLFAVLFF